MLKHVMLCALVLLADACWVFRSASGFIYTVCPPHHCPGALACKHHRLATDVPAQADVAAAVRAGAPLTRT